MIIIIINKDCHMKKLCNCGKEFEKTTFAIRGKCKDCYNEYLRDYYHKNRKKILIRKRIASEKYRKKYPGRITELAIKWRKNNPERAREQANKHSKKHVKRYPTKTSARDRARYGISLEGKTCEICGTKDNLTRHHHNGYSRRNAKRCHILCGNPLSKKSCHYKADRLLKEGFDWETTKQILCKEIEI